MSIASELNNYRNGLDDAWDAAADMGATIPTDRNMVNLDDAIRTIPVSSPNDGVLTITQNGVTIQTFSADQATNVTAALTDTTYSDFTGATSSVAGAHGLVPAPTTSDPDKYLKGDGTWSTPAGTTYTAGTNIQISNQNVISATDTTYSNFTGATSSVAGVAGLVPAPAAGDDAKYLKGDGTWGTVDSGASLTLFYMSVTPGGYSEGDTFPIYKDSARTVEATSLEFFNAVMAGTVRIICDGSNAYDVQFMMDNSRSYGDNDENYYTITDLSNYYNGAVYIFEWDGQYMPRAKMDHVLPYQKKLTAGTNITINNTDPINPVISATDTTYSNFTGATSSVAGVAGLVPAPTTADPDKYLKGDGSWGTPTDTTYTAGTNVSISAQNVISATDTTYSDFTGATASVAGAHGLVPAPSAGDQGKALHGDGTWKDTTAKLVEMSYGESSAWAKFIAAYTAGSIVYCRASSNANPATGSQTRKAFMAYVNNATSPTSVEFQYVRSASSKTDSQQTDQVFVYTLTNSNGGTWSVASRNMGPKINVSGPITKTFTSGANATITIGADAMTGATSGAAGAAGIVPAPAAGDQDKVLKGDGTWANEQGELFFTYTQDSDASGNVSIDIPLDWSKYKIIHIYGAHQQSSSASSGWLTNYLLDENKNAAMTMMMGNEIDGDGSWHGIYREKSDGEAVSCGTAAGTQIWVDATIMKVGGNNVVGYNANACGGTRAQDIMGRSWLSSGDASPSYFRVTFNYPKADGWVMAYGYR